MTACVQAVAVPLPLQISRFQVWGSKSQSRQLFRFFPSPDFLQRSINGELILDNLVDWLIDLSCHWSHITKTLPWLGFEPQTRKRGIWSGTGTATACWMAAHARHAVTTRCRGKEGKRPVTAYCLTQCSNGCSLGSLLWPRQDNHVQTCTMRTKQEKWDETAFSVKQWRAACIIKYWVVSTIAQMARHCFTPNAVSSHLSSLYM